MDFAFSADQDELRTAARRLLAERLPAERLHALADAHDPRDASLWREFAELGWVGLSTPDGGGTFLDEAVLLEEAGAALLPSPLLSSVICGPVFSATATDTATDLTADPSTTTAFAGATGTVATRAEGWSLSGDQPDVVDLGVAGQVIVLATTPDGPGLFLVIPEPRAVAVHLTTDGTRRIGTLTLEQTAATLLADPATTAGLLTALRRRAEASVALESVGVAQRMLDLAADHAKQREQFGRVIGTYQGISHRIADVYVRVELARSLAYRAAWCVATSETEPEALSAQEVDVACASAKAAATETAVFAAEAAIQVLGGIGMTWEHVAHRYYKRALANEVYAGSPAQHRATVATALLGAVR